MNKPDINTLYRTQLSEKYFKNAYPEYRDYLNERYPELDWHDKLYIDQHNLDAVPVCPVCGRKLKLLSIFQGYSKFCSRECANKGGRWDVFRATMKERYGDIFALRIPASREKRKKTNLERYGVEEYSSTKECRNKVNETCRKRYGDNYKKLIFSTKAKEARHKHRLENCVIPNQIGYTEAGEWIMKCHHPECNKCKERTFVIKSGNYFDRTRLHIELCTNLNPINHDRMAGTSLEMFVRSILDEYGIKYETNVRNIISPRELDIYIPDKNIAIECNGVYWHSTYDSEHHRDKYGRCEGKGIRLISIWEDWIKGKPEITHSIILSKLGIYERRIYARQCTVADISSQEAAVFLNENHIQGDVRTHIRKCLLYENRPVAVMCFSRRRGCSGNKTRTPDTWVLDRFCTLRGWQVVGGAGRMLKHFIDEYNPGIITSFSCNDISDGGLYKELGFEMAGTANSYWYVDPVGRRRYHRTYFCKNNIIRMGWKDTKGGWTEAEVTKEHGLYRIFDSGTTKWVLKIK